MLCSHAYNNIHLVHIFQKKYINSSSYFRKLTPQKTKINKFD